MRLDGGGPAIVGPDEEVGQVPAEGAQENQWLRGEIGRHAAFKKLFPGGVRVRFPPEPPNAQVVELADTQR